MTPIEEWKPRDDRCSFRSIFIVSRKKIAKLCFLPFCLARKQYTESKEQSQMQETSLDKNHGKGTKQQALIKRVSATLVWAADDKPASLFRFR